MYENDSDWSENEDGEYKPSSGTHASKKAEANGNTQKHAGYRIRNVLKVPRPTTYTTQAIYEQIHSSDINLEPDYQREVVWPEAKQTGVIDSIFRNFYIPPVIFAVNQHEDGSETKTCIDGKQRLTSIYRFIDGLIYYKDPFTNEKLWYKDVGTTDKGPKKKILPDKYRRLFANKQIVCIEYQDISDEDEREIFQRVQLGMALTPAEKLQGLRGPMPTFIRELNATYLKGGLVGDALDWDRSRGSDFRCIAQALCNIEKFSEGQMTSYNTLYQLEKWLARSPEPSPAFRERVHDTYRVFVGLALEQKVGTEGKEEVFGTPSRISPMEFIMISLLIAVHKDQMTPAQLSTAVILMRADARRQHVDIRMNDRVAKTMIEFIKEYKPGKLTQYNDGGGSDGGEAAGSLAGTKRKREDEQQQHSKIDSPAIVAPQNTPLPPRNSSSSDTLSTNGISVIPPGLEKHGIAVMDRLAAIRAAKDKLNTAPVSTPISHPSFNPVALRINVLPSSLPKTENNSNSLERGLMARMSFGQNTAGSSSLDRGNKPTQTLSRHSTPDGGGGRGRSIDRGRDGYRDRTYRRSVSSERSAQSRSRRPHDGDRDWDYKSHRGRHHEYPSRDPKGKT